MADEKGRRSMGQNVRQLAVQYFEGLAGLEKAEAEKFFKSALSAGDPLANSALRMAEHEIVH